MYDIILIVEHTMVEEQTYTVKQFIKKYGKCSLPWDTTRKGDVHVSRSVTGTKVTVYGANRNATFNILNINDKWQLHGKFSGFHSVSGNKVVKYYKCNTLHRAGKPAIILYYSNGNKEKEWYVYNGMYHRENGPAIIDYDINGDVVITEYWCMGAKQEYIITKAARA